MIKFVLGPWTGRDKNILYCSAESIRSFVAREGCSPLRASAHRAFLDQRVILKLTRSALPHLSQSPGGEGAVRGVNRNCEGSGERVVNGEARSACDEGEGEGEGRELQSRPPIAVSTPTFYVGDSVRVVRLVFLKE